ncbi:hypothetical protein PMN64_39375 [Bradyrhizobium sp. UFLA01-814]|uniref:hypothetical protein n=1 Tax=Bradyrhizobium sp. UFLA01-814 TaxID=3023480 RepID=UPI00398AE76D
MSYSLDVYPLSIHLRGFGVEEKSSSDPERLPMAGRLDSERICSLQYVETELLVHKQHESGLHQRQFGEAKEELQLASAHHPPPRR